MKEKKVKSKWVGCSDYEKRRKELLKAHEEFQKMIADGWHIAEAKKKRPRIPKSEISLEPKAIVTIVLGNEITINIKDFKSHYEKYGYRVIRKIY